MNHGVRPNRLWHWAAIAFLTATFLAEPRAFLAITWDLFQGAGTLGAQLLTNEPDTQPEADTEASSTEPAPVESGSTPTVSIDETTVHSVLDTSVNGVLRLHDEVEEIQTAGGFTLNIGHQGGGS